MLTVEITKDSVTRTMPRAWSISLLVSLKKDGVMVSEQTISQDYKSGDSLADIQGSLQEKAQAVVDKYKSEMAIFDNALLDAAVTNIQNRLVI